MAYPEFFISHAMRLMGTRRVFNVAKEELQEQDKDKSRAIARWLGEEVKAIVRDERLSELEIYLGEHFIKSFATFQTGLHAANTRLREWWYVVNTEGNIFVRYKTNRSRKSDEWVLNLSDYSEYLNAAELVSGFLEEYRENPQSFKLKKNRGRAINSWRLGFIDPKLTYPDPLPTFLIK